MNKEIIILDLFSGIGGFPLGLEKAGFKMVKHYFSEINKHSIAVYQHQFKNAKNVGAIENIKGNKIERPHIITFGSPCQDFSIAGKRKGLEGNRSSLILEAIRIIKETRPDLFIWENVKGTFSSNRGRDFQAILQSFANIGGYRLEWQLLNTKWFLPQNRERIFLIGHLAGASEPCVFPFTENDSLFDKTQQKKKDKNKVASTICSSSYKINLQTNFIEIPQIAGTLTVGGNSGGLHSDMTVIPVITPDRKEKRQNGRRFKEDGDPAFTLTAQDRHGVLISGVAMERTEKGKELRRKYDKGEINHGYSEYKKAVPRKDGLANTIDSSEKSQRIFDGDTEEMKIRRLTEIECERLQGFPDNWTKLGSYGGKIKKISKTQRYIMNGNAATVDVIAAIGNRLLNS